MVYERTDARIEVTKNFLFFNYKRVSELFRYLLEFIPDWAKEDLKKDIVKVVRLTYLVKKKTKNKFF